MLLTSTVTTGDGSTESQDDNLYDWEMDQKLPAEVFEH